VSAWLSLLGALIWPVPALLRAPAAERGLAYVALAGCASASLFAIGLALRPSRRTPSSTDASWSAVLTLALGLALAPLIGLGHALKLVTHHRPLGAVTFAILGLMLLALLVLLARSALSVGVSRSRLGSALVYALGAGGVLSALFAALVLGRAVIQHATLARALPDAGLGVLLVAVIWRLRAPWLERSPRLLHAGLPLCCALWLASLWLVRSDLDVRATVKSAPIVAGVAGFVMH
jgi:vacuolar-type H+-ATPase subunit I/STV1